MCKPSPLEECAQRICSASRVISLYHASEGKLQSSFSPESTSITIPEDAPPSVMDARQTIVSAAATIQQLMEEPTEYLPNLQVHYQHLSCLRWLCHFNVMACIPLTGSVPYSEIATVAGVPEIQLRSVCRMAMTSNLLCEPKVGEIAHNAVSKTFVGNPGLVDWALFMTQFSMPTAAKMVEATEKWGSTSKKNETAFNLAMDTDLPLFDFVKKSPEMTKQFAGYMRNVQSSEKTHIRHLVSGYDWKSLGNAVVVDVGGSTCSSSIALATAFPNLRFVVEDLPETVENSKQILAALPESIRSRITTCGHNFFTPQPVTTAQIYLLRMILHDWPAAEAITILSNHLEVLKANPSARLLVMDTVLPVSGSVPKNEEALLRVRDLAMVQAFNSKERELGEFEDLFERTRDAEGGLVLKNTFKPTESVMTVMEVAYERTVASSRSSGISNGHNGNVIPLPGITV
ncbi:S-adenosyl-L-methionine-dependent methyltransferase [Glarea lozoyensis ATCC 20868]|uniref:S-adenosyl-L-methionine-dependent methyltransferase n=1 Tax=Glarea lozoyensis (strain ATCC 20868 / MF5171) TaxID=1116229 RepID=S3DDD3_GLAL2|nr:S-adenosyl-L-methionine-dependent methyltransferase [Glarea lozoyensis ATCC 20868]EPE30001.1 S-adenosyl-L-methionine-dependent methyltransferase [Glarea lozoyensis ATCC 20868]